MKYIKIIGFIAVLAVPTLLIYLDGNGFFDEVRATRGPSIQPTEEQVLAAARENSAFLALEERHGILTLHPQRSAIIASGGASRGTDRIREIENVLIKWSFSPTTQQIIVTEIVLPENAELTEKPPANQAR